MNLLFVENHTIFAENVSRQFLSQHSVTVVPSLTAARKAMLDKVFDILLVDYDLDDGKGDELLRTLRDYPKFPMVIAVSSHDEGNAALVNAGAAAVCSKMRFDQIQTVIDSLTKKKD